MKTLAEKQSSRFRRRPCGSKEDKAMAGGDHGGRGGNIVSEEGECQVQHS